MSDTHSQGLREGLQEIHRTTAQEILDPGRIKVCPR